MCILIVEDEDLIRLILAEHFTSAGFEVCEAADGDAAAVLIRDKPTAFSLLVTDIHMPGSMAGTEVAKLMHERNPDVPVIYITGRPDALNAIGKLGRQEAVLAKPFVPSALLRLAQRLLLSQGTGRRE
ncbi:MAG TPA: response regulator [Acidisphaera sp.]|nr:response regulator [Acidisphaera sp.]